MEERPKLKLKLTTSDRVLECMGWFFLTASWLLTFINYDSLPEIIPIHFNGAGEADGFGDKWTILTLPLVATVMFVGLTFLNRFPHIFNYPTAITKENALIQYTNATRLIRFLKLIIVLIFGLIDMQTIRHAHGQTEGLGIWFLPLTMALIFIPMIYYFVISSKSK